MEPVFCFIFLSVENKIKKNMVHFKNKKKLKTQLAVMLLRTIPKKYYFMFYQVNQNFLSALAIQVNNILKIWK